MSSIQDKMRDLGTYQIWESPASAPDEAALRHLEAKLGRALPHDFCCFIKEYGQCGFEQKVAFPIDARFPEGQLGTVSVLFGLTADNHYYLAVEYERTRDRMPPHMLPFASDPGGSLLTLSVGSDDYGAVYYWDHRHVEVPWSRFQQMAHDLTRRGVDTQMMSTDAIILRWEEQHAGELRWRPGYGNLYMVAPSFHAFVESLSLLPVWR